MNPVVWPVPRDKRRSRRRTCRGCLMRWSRTSLTSRAILTISDSRGSLRFRSWSTRSTNSSWAIRVMCPPWDLAVLGMSDSWTSFSSSPYRRRRLPPRRGSGSDRQTQKKSRSLTVLHHDRFGKGGFTIGNCLPSIFRFNRI